MLMMMTKNSFLSAPEAAYDCKSFTCAVCNVHVPQDIQSWGALVLMNVALTIYTCTCICFKEWFE